jgi:putative membrane protein
MFEYVWHAFDFQDWWHPEFIIITLLLAAGYLTVAGPLRTRLPNAEPVPFRKKALFLTGLLLFYISLGSPLYLMGSFLFSAHMLQMALFSFYHLPFVFDAVNTSESLHIVTIPFS